MPNIEHTGWYATFETFLSTPDPLTGVTDWQDSTRAEIERFCQIRGWRLDAMIDVTEGGVDGAALVTLDELDYTMLLNLGLIEVEATGPDGFRCKATIVRD